MAQRLGVVALILVVLWALFTNTTEDFLGGISWAHPKVFNWHPIMMVAGMVICTTEGTISTTRLPWICVPLVWLTRDPFLFVLHQPSLPSVRSRSTNLSTGACATSGTRWASH